MKKVLFALTAIVSLAVSTANAQTAVTDPGTKAPTASELRVTPFPGGKQIDIITTVDTGLFTPRVTRVNTILCLDGQPCIPLGTADARGPSVAGTILTPAIDAGGYVAGMALVRPTHIQESSSTNVNNQGGTTTATANPSATAAGGQGGTGVGTGTGTGGTTTSSAQGGLGLGGNSSAYSDSNSNSNANATDGSFNGNDYSSHDSNNNNDYGYSGGKG